MGGQVKLWTLDSDLDAPEYFDKVGVGVAETYASLRLKLEEEEVLDWAFDFWDIEDSRRIRRKVERLNNIKTDVYVLPQQNVDLEPVKRRRLQDGSYTVMSGLQVEGSVEQEFVLLAEDGGLQSVDPVSSSRVSGSVEGIDLEEHRHGDDHHHLEEDPLKATLISKDVMERYQVHVEKLRRDLKDASLEDHAWELRSWDQEGVGVVKLYCVECRKECGGQSGNHSKTTIQNLFSNFRTSHLNSVQHIKNWCRKHNVDYCNHPQSEALKGKTVPLSPEEHKKLIQEGTEIMEAVNATLDEGILPFRILGPPNDPNPKSFWYKVKCAYCRELMGLCPPKKNLEWLLRSHMGGSKHMAAVEESKERSRGASALLTGKRGRPKATSSVSVQSNQPDLRAWLSTSGSNSQQGSGESICFDNNSLMCLMCWGFRGPQCVYAGVSYDVTKLLDDPHVGRVWFPEPHLRGTVKKEGQIVEVNGTFRHRDCNRLSVSRDGFLNFTCSMCAQVPNENDFRKRVIREDQALVKRGFRTTAGGMRLGYLSLAELARHGRDVTMKLKMERLQLWAAKARIVQLKVKRPTLREMTRNISEENTSVNAKEEQNIIKFCNNILNAHRTNAFGGKPALWDFLKDVAGNLNRDSRGNRYTVNTKSFVQAMKVYGGRRMCDLFALNYGGPSYRTISRDVKKGVQFVPGEHSEIFAAVAQIYRDAKHAHGITCPVPVILAEDETKVKGRVAWEAKWDTLAGFCGPKLDHVCDSSFKPIVGSGHEGYNNIVDSFESNKIGGFARVIVVNPLHDKLPRLTLVVSCTCNCFDSSWVRRQWDTIDNLWDQECKSVVGPIVGHASDGDSRRRQLMLQDYRGLDGPRFTIGWEGWLLSATLDSNGNVRGLHDQDYIHNGKKLINPLWSAIRVMQLGGDVSFYTHIGQVYNRFTSDEHGLKQEDIDRKDRQNWASAQRICQVKVRSCLKRLRETPDSHRERTLGTEYYLEICADYIEIFCSPRHDLRSRIVLAAKVSLFFRLWKLWIKQGDHSVFGNSEAFTEAKNFVSQQCFLDIQISCHFVVLLICHFRDRYSDLPVPLHLTGSDSCEVFFSKIGGMNGLERAYDFHELVNAANTLNHLCAIEYKENGLKFKKVHNKMENIWAKLHPLQDGEAPCNLSDYTAVATNSDVVEALKEGLMAAQGMLRALNMAPTVHACASKKVWFLKPWVLERADSTHLAFKPGKKKIMGDDGDSEVMRESLIENPASQIEGDISMSAVRDHLEDDLVDDGLEGVIAIEEETRDAIADMLNSHEQQVQAIPIPSKVNATVQFGGHCIFKSTLVSQLNGNPFLSKDRLTRVKNSMYFNNHDDYITAHASSSTCLLGIGSDCGIYFVQRSTLKRTSAVKAVAKRQRGKQSKSSKAGTPMNVLQGVDEGTWWIGRVQSMRKRFGKSWGLLRHPVDLQCRHEPTGKKTPPPPTIEVMLYYFRKHLGNLKFKYDHTDSIWVDVDTIITTVSLNFNSSTGVYTLEKDDAAAMDEFVADKQRQKQ